MEPTTSEATFPSSDDNTTRLIKSRIHQFQEPETLRIFRFLTFSVITVASLCGNFIVCKAIKDTPFCKPFSYYLVANMAAAEIVNSLCLPFMLAYRETGRWILGQVGCSLVVPVQALSVLVVTSSMALIALYRLRVVATASVSRRPAGKLKVAVICCIWLGALLVNLPLFIGFKLEGRKCVRRFQGDANKYYIARFILIFAVPYGVMTASYGAVAWRLRQHIQIQTQEYPSFQVPSSKMPTANIAVQEGRKNFHNTLRAAESTESQECRGSKSNTADLERDLLKMIYVIIIVFVVCYFPYQVMFLWENIAQVKSFQFRHHMLLQKYVFIMTCLPSAIHPLCYGTMNKFYARAFSMVFLCKKG